MQMMGGGGMAGINMPAQQWQAYQQQCYYQQQWAAQQAAAQQAAAVWNNYYYFCGAGTSTGAANNNGPPVSAMYPSVQLAPPSLIPMQQQQLLTGVSTRETAMDPYYYVSILV